MATIIEFRKAESSFEGVKQVFKEGDLVSINIDYVSSFHQFNGKDEVTVINMVANGAVSKSYYVYYPYERVFEQITSITNVQEV